MTPEKFRSLSRPISIEEVQEIVKELTPKKLSVLDGFTGQFCEAIKVKIIPVPFRLFHIIDYKMRIYLYKATITLTLRPEKDYANKQKKYR